MTNSKKPPKWTWPAAVIATVMVADLCALTWYLWQLPIDESHRWEKTVGTVAGWIASAIAFWGIKHGVGRKLSLTELISLRPFQLSIVVITVGVWFFILPFHSITLDVNGPAAAPLSGVTAAVDDAGGLRPYASDAHGELRVSGLMASTHKILLKKSGYKTEELNVTFWDVLTMGRLHPRPLDEADEMVVINSDQPDALTFVDSESESRGPARNSVWLRPGPHRITLRLPGYQPSSGQVTVQSGIPTPPMTLNLHPLPAAKVPTYAVLIDSIPPGADIYEGNRRLGTTTANIRLPAGQHTIEFRKDGYRAIRSTVSIPEQNMFSIGLKVVE